MQDMSILDSFSLDGRVAIVTGASSGLGAGFARALADAGADVVLAARRTDRLTAVAAEIEATGRRVLSVQTDVTSPDDCTALAEAAVSDLGRLDILVNNAGVGTAVPALHETPDEFRGVVEVNLLGAYWMAQACARVMEPGSSIINIASVLGMVKSWAPQAAYAASKAGLIGLTRDLANQWSGRKGIRVNALAPGYFSSEMTDQIPVEVVQGYLMSHTPLGRMGEQSELDAAVIFLASPAASYITGVTLPVDGGLTMH
jgi:NAD(P)-dependent dehydrogenase (short-subunit alcohol dehydrogenase family)